MFRYTPRDDGMCERDWCSTSSYSRRPRKAERLAIFIPKDPNKYERPMETETAKVCKVHGGVLKRQMGDTFHTFEVLDTIPDDIEAAATKATDDFRREQQQARDERAASLRRETPKQRAQFFGPAQRSGETMAKLSDKPDLYGLRHIEVKEQGGYLYRSGLTPAEAESLAYRLLDLASQARNASGGMPEALKEEAK